MVRQNLTRKLVACLVCMPLFALGAHSQETHYDVQYRVIDLGALPDCDTTYATSVNEEGWVTGYACRHVPPDHGDSMASHPFAWHNDKLTELPTLGGKYGQALAINLQGDMAGHAQTAEDILHKAGAIYTNAKTYQATYHWEQKFLNADKQGDPTIKYDAKVKAIGLTKFAISDFFDNSKEYKHKGQPNILSIVDDSVHAVIYEAGGDSYFRRTHEDFMSTTADHRALDTIIPQLTPSKGFTYTLLAPTIVNRKTVYVIEATGEVEEWGGEIEARKVKVKVDDLFYINQKNFHLIQKKSTETFADGTLTIKTTQIIRSEVLNAPIPAGTFVFKAPKGVKAQ